VTNPREEFERRRRLAELGAHAGTGPVDDAAIAAAEVQANKDEAKIRASGRGTAHERLSALLDPGSFVELDPYVTHACNDFDMRAKRPYGDGVVTGHGLIDGRPVFVFLQRPEAFGGALGRAHANKICKVMDLALDTGAPVIGLNDSGGARIQEGVESLGGYAEIFKRNVLLSGVVPQISVVLGPCAGGAVYSPALTDLVLMVEDTSYMFVTGPEVIKAVTHEEVTKEALGGATTHSERSGVAHFRCSSETHALAMTRQLLTFLPSNNLDDVPRVPSTDPIDRQCPDLQGLVPSDPSKPYDIREVIRSIADDQVFLEVHQHFARNIVVGFTRIGGQAIGVVANQPLVLAGCLDIDASVKGARFVRTCDAFNIPLLTLVDVPGFLPGTAQEFGGIIRHGAKLLYAFTEATVPKVTIVTRKAYGGAYDVMSSKHIRADINLAYPTAEIAVMGAEGAINIMYRRELGQSDDPVQLRRELAADYRERFANPYRAAELGFIDQVIAPEDTRRWVARSFALLKNKRQDNPRRKHGNIPL